MKLGIQIAKFNKKLAVQIFEQTELPINQEVFLSSSQNFRLHCESEPELTNSTFYLRGDHETVDFKLMTRAFDSEALLDEYLQKIITTIKAWIEQEDGIFNLRDLGHTYIITASNEGVTHA